MSIRRSRHLGTLKVRHRPELCAWMDHRGIAEQIVDGVLCRVHVAHRDRVLEAWWANQSEATGQVEVRLLPAAHEPPVAFRLVG